MRRAAFLALALSCGPGLLHAAEPDLQRQQAEARRDQQALRDRIRRLEGQITGSESARRDVSVALKASETAISELDRQLEMLAADTKRAGAELSDVQRRIGEQTTELQKRQARLASQLRAQYAGGLSPWAALLSGEDPQDIARELGYLEYVSRAQAQAVVAVRSALEELAALKSKAQAYEADLQRLAEETTERRGELAVQQAERREVLTRIEQELQRQRGEAKRLANNEQRLGSLVDALGVAIEEEAAAARRREEEARRKAEERRRAEEKRQAEERRRAEEARRAAQAEREARVREEEATQEDGRITGRVEGVAPGTESAQGAAPAAPSAEPATGARASMELKGLGKGLPYPVRGDIQGRFGMERPEGGTWRGIVLRVAAGTRVAAVAPGRVVYAGWLGGFGNLMIVDHGAKYLSVYAYNQSLLRQVGDFVSSGDAIATVGATGGQVEPGLYFEIRHEGRPVNPLLWLRK